MTKYDFGFTDYRAIHGTPDVEWTPIKVSRTYDYQLILAYVGLAISMSMVVAPMAWVKLFMWLLS